MAIRVHWKPYPRNRQADQTRSALSAIRTKASDTLAYAKLHHTVAELEDEIALQLRAIGELVYATHRGTPSDSGEMQKILEYVDDLHDEIDGHKEQMKLLLHIVPCPICGEDVTEGDVYCQNCGQPLPVPSPHKF